jgi:hypothetical protein
LLRARRERPSPAARKQITNQSTAALSRLAGKLTALSPVNVISVIEGDDHHTREIALAGELMRHVARHHRESAWPKPRGRMIGHLGQNCAANDDQLLFGGMEMLRNHASWGCLQDQGRATSRRITAFDRRQQTFDVIIRRKFHG